MAVFLDMAPRSKVTLEKCLATQSNYYSNGRYSIMSGNKMHITFVVDMLAEKRAAESLWFPAKKCITLWEYFIFVLLIVWLTRELPNEFH